MGLMRTVDLLDSDEIREGAVGVAAIDADQVKQSELAYETADILFEATATSGATSGTTSGSVVLGHYIKEVSGTPAASKLTILAPTDEIGARLSAAPGTNNALIITAVLLKP